MSSEIVIEVENLGKIYQIYATPNDRLKQFIYPRLERIIGRPVSRYYREFWALKDASFAIKKGETIGVIGLNGSGKSTLLQIICGTLNPTMGSIQTRGRIAALLELGSGFNPEFTGRENIYMNATVLGLTSEEINARFDQIIAFADIGDFIEQPVKTYSSGMYVRLAFAVIAHVDADILVIDEALSVGDAVFTQKCMRFVRQFREKGTLIFVSHDVSAVQNLCESAIWLDQGQIRMAGDSKTISEAYLQFTLQKIYGNSTQLNSVAPKDITTDYINEAPSMIEYGALATVNDNIEKAKGWETGISNILSIKIEPLTNSSEEFFKGGERVRLTIRAKAHEALQRPILGFIVRDRLGQDLFGENTLTYTDLVPTSIDVGGIFEGVFEFRLPALPNGQYAVMCSVADGDLYNNVQHHWMHDALIINVSASKMRYGLVGLHCETVKIDVIHA